MRTACRSSILQLAWAQGGKDVPRYFQWARTGHLWRSSPPPPPPSPQGEGELSATLGAKGDPISLGARTAPSPWGEGWGEGDRDGRQTKGFIATYQMLDEAETNAIRKAFL